MEENDEEKGNSFIRIFLVHPDMGGGGKITWASLNAQRSLSVEIGALGMSGIRWT